MKIYWKGQRVFFLLLSVLFYSSGLAQEKLKVVKTGTLTLGQQIEVYSQLLDENRLLNIYLPVGYYSDSLKSYPLIYLLDGSEDEDFIHVAGIVQFGTFSWIKMLPESIVVGIANVDRKRDFTYPSKNKLDQKDFPTSGHSARFISFLEKELQTFIASNYRTSGTSTIIGQSLGGLLASEILLKKPELFDNYLIVSPSLWWDDGSLLKTSAEAYTSNKAIYIAVGNEGEVMEQSARALYEQLKEEQKENTQLYFDFLEDKSHGDALHEAVYRGLEQVFR
jgi:predicted alpha/beta superfamily hydrolase